MLLRLLSALVIAVLAMAGCSTSTTTPDLIKLERVVAETPDLPATLVDLGLSAEDARDASLIIDAAVLEPMADMPLAMRPDWVDIDGREALVNSELRALLDEQDYTVVVAFLTG